MRIITTLLIVAAVGAVVFAGFGAAAMSSSLPNTDNDALRIGLLDMPHTTNPLALLSADGATLWSQAVFEASALSLAGPLGPQGDYFPVSASLLVNQADFKTERLTRLSPPRYVTTVPLRRDLFWSDGTPLTAHDVAFTYETLLRIDVRSLGGNWTALFPADLLERVEARDAHTVTFWFRRHPGLGQWQYGLLAVPLLQQATWEPHVTASLQTDHPARTLAQTPLSAPVLGPRRVEEDLRSVPHPKDVRSHEKLLLFEAGGAALTNLLSHFEFRRPPIGGAVLATAVGESVAVPVVFEPFTTRADAQTALIEGKIAGWIDPLRFQTDPDHVGLRLLSFNLRRATTAALPLRRAVQEILNRDALIAHVVGVVGERFPLVAQTSLVPAAHAQWHAAAPRIRAEHAPFATDVSNELERRVLRARRLLEGAGYTWHDERLHDPHGQPVGPFVIASPTAAYDPVSAASAAYIADLLTKIGVESTIDALPFPQFRNTLLHERQFDLAVVGWRLNSGAFPHHLALLLASEGASPGGWNVSGYQSAEYDALVQRLLEATTSQEARLAAESLESRALHDLPLIPLLAVGAPVQEAPLKTAVNALWPALSPRHSTMWLE